MSVRSTPRLALAVLCLAARPALAATPVEPAVALLDEAPWMPVEAAGSGIDPVVSAVVHLNDRGKPASVDIVRIDPSSPHDAAFGQAARDAILRWRFAPALRDGRRVESTVERQVRFRERPPGGVARRLEPGARRVAVEARGEEKALWSHFFTLSAPEQDALRERLAREGEARLGPTGRSSAVTDRFEVSTDLTGEDVARKIARNLEASYGATYRLLGERIPPQPSKRRTLVFVYSSRAALQSLAAVSSAPVGGDGFYHPVGILAFHAELVANELLTSVILHEGVHAFLEAHVVRPGAALPLWFDEGLAQYIANSDVKDGKIVAGSHSRNTTYKNPYVTWRGRSMASVDADQLRKAMRSGKAPTLETLLAATPATFYGESSDLYYAEAWLFVHFLRHGRPGWEDDAFPRLVLYLAEGFDDEDVLPSIYGATASGLAAEFAAYVKKF